MPSLGSQVVQRGGCGDLARMRCAGGLKLAREHRHAPEQAVAVFQELRILFQGGFKFGAQLLDLVEQLIIVDRSA